MSRVVLSAAGIATWTLLLMSTVSAALDEEDETPIFEFDVRPILQKHCSDCHGAEKREASLDVRTPGSLLRGGDSGSAIEQKSAENSILFQLILNGTMPPKGRTRLTLDEQDVIRRWIDGGTLADSQDDLEAASPVLSITQEDRQHYSFRRVVPPDVPSVLSTDRVRTPIDCFVLAKLEEKALGFSSDADRMTLARRVWFDLVGLPPSPDELQAFLLDEREDAFQQLADRLLGSPQFGVRWGRHWLDVAGYADVYGSDENAPTIRVPPGGWRYRDYVVNSFNRDKAYDKFLVEQIAGDELSDWRHAAEFTEETVEQLVATGFLRTAIDDTDQSVLNIRSNRFAVIFDQMEIFGTSVLGLTLQCARCHSHKFDPIPSRDYYRLVANFTPAFNPDAWVTLDQRRLPDVPQLVARETDEHNAECHQQIGVLRGKLDDLDWTADLRLLPDKLKAVKPEHRQAVRQAFKAPAKRSDVDQTKLAEYADELLITEDERNSIRSQEERHEVRRLHAEIAGIQAAKRPSYGTIQALFDTGPPGITRMLVRGQVDVPGRPVQPGFLSVLCESEHHALTSPAGDHSGTSGRRLAVARWLTSRQSPASGLVARVMVNRIWHHLFGRGIVATPGNLGVGGAPPTHPQLLDWLASSFVDNGWRVKPLIRLMITSTVYRQVSATTVQTGPHVQVAKTVDPQNYLLWRMRLRRLESEAIRDTILAVSGSLDSTLGGASVPIAVQSDGTIVFADKQLPTPTSQWRRSLYILSRRNYHMPIFGVFDAPAMTTNCTSRERSTVVLQSLTMLNDGFVQHQAAQFARRLIESSPPDEWIPMAFRIALSRHPTKRETELCRRLLVEQSRNAVEAGTLPKQCEQKALENLCHMLLNTNNFLYIE